MTSTTGLRPRRNAGGLNSASSSSNEPSLPPTVDRNVTSDSGVKIAVDPKDLIDDEDRRQPKLTLMEEVLLLGLKDKQVGSSQK